MIQKARLILRHQQRRMRDAIRHSATVREAAARLRAITALTPAALTRAYELASHPWLRASIVRSLNSADAFDQADYWRAHAAESPRYREMLAQRRELTRAMILKAAGQDGERGALLLTFEYNWVRLICGLTPTQRRWLDDHYNLVLSTSWSPTDYGLLAMMLSHSSRRLWVQTNNLEDREAIEAFHPRLSCLHTMPCDWLNADQVKPLPRSQRDIDLIIVANWAPFKRHWDAFDLLRQLPAHWKIALIGQPAAGRKREHIEALAREYQVPQQLEIHQSLRAEQVAALQCRSKLALIMSRREGCCVAVVEAMMAGAAVAMRADAHIGSRVHINPQTGALLHPERMAADLLHLMQTSADMDPRSWCLQHCNNQRSGQQLNDAIKAHECTSGRPWTRDLALPMWRPHPTFACPEQQAELKPAYQQLNQLAPQIFPLSLWDRSWQ